MLRALVICALLAAAPAMAEEPAPPEAAADAAAGAAPEADPDPEVAPDVPPVAARIVLAHGLVEDLLAQYALAHQTPDPEIAPLPPDALPHWTVPIVDDAAHALGALVSLRPDAADPFAVARARAAIGAVYDNVAWDPGATEVALADLADALGTLAGDLRQQQAEDPALPEVPAPAPAADPAE